MKVFIDYTFDPIVPMTLEEILIANGVTLHFFGFTKMYYWTAQGEFILTPSGSPSDNATASIKFRTLNPLEPLSNLVFTPGGPSSPAWQLRLLLVDN